jgi:hypothetical protein
VIKPGYTLTDPTHSAPQQTLCREQRHLGVVGDLTLSTVHFGKISDAALPEAIQNLGARHELHGTTEGISYGTP